MRLLATAIDPDPIFAGKREKLWLPTCSGTGHHAGAAPEISLPLHILTAQECALLAEITKGKLVHVAGRQVGLQRSRTFEVWSDIKTKLGIRSAYQLRQ